MKYLFFILFYLCSNALSSDVCTCPTVCQNKEELGRGTWRLLHDTVRANQNNPFCEKDLTVFMSALSVLYPCAECRAHIQEYLSTTPVQCTQHWMCEFHNVVNLRLKKELFDCDTLGHEEQTRFIAIE